MLSTIIVQKYQLDFVNKGYVNKYINKAYLQEYKCYDYSMHRLKNAKNEIITKTSFYYFTKNSNVPKYFTNKNEWQQIYDNFRLLRSYSSHSTNKRKSDESNNQVNLISTTNEFNIVSPSPPQTTNNFRRRLTIKDIIGRNFFATKQAKILFNCKDDETVYECLSRRIFFQ